MTQELNDTQRELFEAFSKKLHKIGSRAILEFILDINRGRDLHEIIADFSRIDPAVYAALCTCMTIGGGLA